MQLSLSARQLYESQPSWSRLLGSHGGMPPIPELQGLHPILVSGFCGSSGGPGKLMIRCGFITSRPAFTCDPIVSLLVCCLHHVHKLLMPSPTYPISHPNIASTSIVCLYLIQIPMHYLATLCPDPRAKGISPDDGMLHLAQNYTG